MADWPDRENKSEQIIYKTRNFYVNLHSVELIKKDFKQILKRFNDALCDVSSKVHKQMARLV